MVENGNYRLLKDYFNKLSFIENCNSKIYEAIEEISGLEIRKKVESDGLNKLHKHFSVDYIPFLQFSLDEKLRSSLIKSINDVGKNNLNYKNFYIDKELNFRIIYPYEISLKSKLSRAVYRSIKLKNFKNAKKELNEAIERSKKYKPEYSDTKKEEYFKGLPVPCYGHSPHRDTWFGHTYDALNLWWSITGVTRESGMVMYTDVNDYKLKHTEEPMYVTDDQYLGKPTILNMEDGELLIFDPEILHGTKLITRSDITRIVVSGRISKNKPKFYKMTKAYEHPNWYSSNDISKNINDKIHIFLRKDHSFDSPNKSSKKNEFEIKTIRIDENIKFKKNYKLLDINKLDINCRYKVIFNNFNISIICNDNDFFAFKSECPHLGFDLTTSYYDKNNKKLICNGHSADFDKKGNSGCKILNLRTFIITKEENSIILNT